MKRTPRYTTFSEVIGPRLKSPAFRRAYEQRRMVQEVAVAIRRLREEVGLTQEQLGGLIGVSQPFIARLERGKDPRAPQFDTLSRIATALGRRLEVVFAERRANPEAPIVVVQKARATARASELRA